jgi:hypothetical protein
MLVEVPHLAHSSAPLRAAVPARRPVLQLERQQAELLKC